MQVECTHRAQCEVKSCMIECKWGRCDVTWWRNANLKTQSLHIHVGRKRVSLVFKEFFAVLKLFVSWSASPTHQSLPCFYIPSSVSSLLKSFFLQTSFLLCPDAAAAPPSVRLRLKGWVTCVRCASNRSISFVSFEIIFLSCCVPSSIDKIVWNFLFEISQRFCYFSNCDHAVNYKSYDRVLIISVRLMWRAEPLFCLH